MGANLNVEFVREYDDDYPLGCGLERTILCPIELMPDIGDEVNLMHPDSRCIYRMEVTSKTVVFADGEVYVKYFVKHVPNDYADSAEDANDT